MSQSQPEASLDPSPLADRLDLIAGCWHALLSSPADPSLAGTLRRETEAFGRDGQDTLPEPCSKVLHRLSALLDVWECLTTESPEAAREVGLFCVRALELLGDSDRISRPLDRVVEPILEESSASWGEYLSLLEPPGSLPEEEAPPEDELPAILDEPSHFDAQALLRLFGVAEGPGPEEFPEKGPGPSIQAVDGRGVPAEVKTSPVSSSARLSGTDSLVIPPLPEQIELDDEIREVFLADAIDLSERLQGLVLAVGQGGDTAELRRVLHTLKGAAGCVGLKDLSCLIHALEERLEAEGAEVSPYLTDNMHAMLDYLEGTVRILQRKGSSPTERPTATTPPLASPAIERGPLTEGPSCNGPEPGAVDEGPIRVPSARFDELMDLVSELVVRRRLWSAQTAAMKSISDMVRSFRARMLHSLDRLHEAGLSREDRARRLAPRSDIPGQMRRL